MNRPTMETGRDGTLLVKGELLFATVTALHRDSLPLIAAQQGALLIDLGGVSRADSAGVALLIEWMRLARQRSVELRFRNLPQQLHTIARASDLDELLPIAG